MDKITKLSQAVRLGATFRPQAYGEMMGIDRSIPRACPTVTSCAMAAAYEAITGFLPDASRPATTMTTLQDRFQMPPGTLSDVIRDNDRFHLSREAIADKLEARGL